MLELTKIEGSKGAKLSAHYALVISALVICFLTSFVCAEQKKSSAPGQASAEQLFSPSVGQKFYEITHELAGSNNIDSNQAEQAIVFLRTTSGLDTKSSYVMPDLIKLIRQPSSRTAIWV